MTRPTPSPLTARRPSWWDRTWDRFYALPGSIAALSLLLGLGIPMVDDALGSPLPFVFGGGSDGARALLGTIAGAMISVTGLVFSITMVILQLASSQFTPRIIGSFLESRVTQVTLGVFTGSFLYALSVLRAVPGGETPAVPQTGVAVAYLYVVGAVVMFLAFIHHITESVRVSKVMTQVRERSVTSARRLRSDGAGEHPDWAPGEGTRCQVLLMTDRCGYFTVLDGRGLFAAAGDLGVVIDLDLTPGDFVQAGQPIGRVWGGGGLDGEAQRRLSDLVVLAGDRDFHIDPGFGLRQLLDIADRALSPGINDPTTAVQAINELHVVLRTLATTADPSPYLTDDAGAVRGRYRPHTYADLLSDSVDELVHYGRDSVRILPQLRRMLDDLHRASRPEHRAATGRAVDHLEAVLAAQDRPSHTRSG